LSTDIFQSLQTDMIGRIPTLVWYRVEK
jgi:hypothetical protein